MQLSRRSQQKFADLAADRGTVRHIEQLYAAQGFDLPLDFEPQDGRARRSVCEAAEGGADLTDTQVQQRQRIPAVGQFASRLAGWPKWSRGGARSAGPAGNAPSRC